MDEDIRKMTINNWRRKARGRQGGGPGIRLLRRPRPTPGCSADYDNDDEIRQYIFAYQRSKTVEFKPPESLTILASLSELNLGRYFFFVKTGKLVSDDFISIPLQAHLLGVMLPTCNLEAIPYIVGLIEHVRQFS